MQLTELERELQEAGITIELEAPIPDRDKLMALRKALDNEDDADERKKLLKSIKNAEAAYSLSFHHWVAKQHQHLLFERGEDKTYWNYDAEDGVYVEMNAGEVRGIVMRELHNEGMEGYMKGAFVKDCLCRYRGMYPDRGRRYEDFDNEDKYFHASNGWVHLSTMEFEPHTPDRLSKIKSPVSFDKDATCPVYDGFLDTDLDIKKDAIRVIDQYSGLLLTRENKHQQMLTITGKPGCGKSTLIEMWVHVLGDLVAQSSLSDFMGDKHRFMGSSLAGRTLCWFDEVDVKRQEMGSVLERKITSKQFEVERKGIDGTRYVDNHLKFILTANNLPMSVEDGMYRRLLIIPFQHSFTDDGTADRDMPDKMRAEASGVLNRMLRGLADIRKMRGFTVIDGHADMLEEYKASSNMIAEYLDTYFEPTSDADSFVTTEMLFKGYVGFCGAGKTYSLTPRRFGRLLGSQPLHRFSNMKAHRNKDERGWAGVTLKNGFYFDEDKVMPICGGENGNIDEKDVSW